MEKKLEELIEDDYLHQMQYIAHFETEYMTPVRQMLNKQPTRWWTSR